MTGRRRKSSILAVGTALLTFLGAVWVFGSRAAREGPPLVMLGDSLTEQGDWTRRFSPLDIRNRGVGGEGAAEVLHRLDRVIQERPAAVFLMIGVNDLKIGRPPDAVLRDIRNIATRLQDSGIRVVFQSTVFINPAFRPDINESIRALNGKISDLARTNRVPFYDLNLRLAPAGRLSSEMTKDGLHLNRSGYAAWEQAIEPCIRSLSAGRADSACRDAPDG